MSKPVRLPDYLYEEVQRLASEEKRSLANMVQVLLEQALKMDKLAADAQPRNVTARTIAPPADDHFKPDFKK